MKRIFFLLVLSLSFFLSSALPAAAQDRHAQVRLFSPGGNDAGVEVVLAPGWKTYWRTPGEAGLAPAFDWTGSANLSAAAAHFPAPHRFATYDIENYGYEGRVVFPVSVTPEDAGAPVALRLKLDILVCSDICLPETHVAELSLPAAPAGDALPALPERREGAFTRAYLSYDAENRNYLVVEARGLDPARSGDLFVEHASGVSFGRPATALAGDAVVFTLPFRGLDDFSALSEKLSAGEITLTHVAGETAVEGVLALSPPPAGAAMVAPETLRGKVAAGTGVLRVALFAFLGGLILNLMPCVLPVLSLKVLSVVSHGGAGSRGRIFRNFMASALGILCSFWLMAGVLAAFKAAGAVIGWGIQFQHPAFLVFLILAVTLFAANMWGLFEIPLPRFIARNVQRDGHEPTFAGHFLSGAFATLLATPCTAPFLGTAVGFALARDAAEIFAVFTMIGLGLAAPWMALAVSPRLFRLLPRPGAWMVTMKKFLAVLLLLTAAWLASVLVSITATPALDAGWQAFDEALVAPAVRDGRTVIVDVTADWCLTCKANKRLVLQDAEIEAALSGPEVLRLQADWTQRDEGIGLYLQKNGRYGIPFNIVYGPAAPEGVILPELLTKKAVLRALAEATGE